MHADFGLERFLIDIIQYYSVDQSSKWRFIGIDATITKASQDTEMDNQARTITSQCKETYKSIHISNHHTNQYKQKTKKA